MKPILQEFGAMRTTLPALALASIMFSACSMPMTSINDQNQNPLTAARYGDELADTMANLFIINDPILKEPGMHDAVQKEIDRGKSLGDDARSTIARGFSGPILGVRSDTSGFALYVDDMLYISSDFYTRPGPALHVYLTTLVDPRDKGVTFPDATAVDLGPLQMLYGAHQYSVPHEDKPELLRTFVLYDTKLKMIYSFAQLSHQP